MSRVQAATITETTLAPSPLGPPIPPHPNCYAWGPPLPVVFTAVMFWPCFVLTLEHASLWAFWKEAVLNELDVLFLLLSSVRETSPHARV